MKKIIAPLLFALVLSLPVTGQTPGYLGKHFAIGGSVSLSPATFINRTLFPGDENNMLVKGTIPYLNISLGLHMDIATGRRKMLVIDYGFLKNSITVDLKDNFNEADYSRLNINTHSFLLKFLKHRHSDNLTAPLGFMHGISFGVAIANVYDVDGVFPRNGVATNLKTGRYVTSIVPLLNYSFAYKRIVGKRLLLTTEFNLGILSVLGGLSFGEAGFSSGNNWLGGDNTLEKGVKYSTMARVYKQSVANFQVGISYLLF